jgi:hypothetical protein
MYLFGVPLDCVATVDDFAVIEHRSFQDVAADMFHRGLRDFVEDRERIVAEIRRQYEERNATEAVSTISREAPCRP